MDTEKERINLIFPTIIKEYLKEAAWRNRKSVTQYLLDLIHDDISKNTDIAAVVFDREADRDNGYI